MRRITKISYMRGNSCNREELERIASEEGEIIINEPSSPTSSILKLKEGEDKLLKQIVDEFNQKLKAIVTYSSDTNFHIHVSWGLELTAPIKRIGHIKIDTSSNQFVIKESNDNSNNKFSSLYKILRQELKNLRGKETKTTNGITVPIEERETLCHAITKVIEKFLNEELALIHKIGDIEKVGDFIYHKAYFSYREDIEEGNGFLIAENYLQLIKESEDELDKKSNKPLSDKVKHYNLKEVEKMLED